MFSLLRQSYKKKSHIFLRYWKLLVNMSSRNYFSFLIVFFLPNYLCNISRSTEEEAVMKYIAKEDTSRFLKQMDILGEDYGKTWLVLPDGNGTAQFAFLQKERSPSTGKTVTSKWTLEDCQKYVKFYLYTKGEPEGQVLDLGNIKTSNFDPNKPTKFICHGWMADSESSVIIKIRDAYLETQDVNIIGIDWSYIASDYLYPQPAASTRVVGEYIGDVINSIVDETSTDYKQIHIIGHSLGAHIAGFAGNTTNQKVGRITGLDPALPGFQYFAGKDGRLDEGDAEFVDIIHTCAGVLGMSVLVGHADFYPNGGSPFQPGCSVDKFLTGTQACSHSRSHEFFAESIKHAEFKAIGCQDWEHFKRHNCNGPLNDMGENTSKNVKGVFYLRTATKSPFALGMEGTTF